MATDTFKKKKEEIEEKFLAGASLGWREMRNPI